MKANNFIESASTQSSTLRRTGKSFLVKPAYKASSFMCTEYNFDKTLECPRVIRLEDHLCGIEELPQDQLIPLMGNQPVFYLQERYYPESPRYDWNGLLLFRTDDKKAARQLVKERPAHLHIVMAFDSPLDGHYYMLIATGTDRYDRTVMQKCRFKYKALLERHLSEVKWMSADFFIRAFTEAHYDLVDRDYLFGLPEDTNDGGPEGQKSSIASMEQRPASVASSLKSLFCLLFRRSA